MPLALPRRRVEGQDRVRVEVVPRAQVAVPVGGGVPGGPVERVADRVVGSRRPGRCAAGLVGIAGPRVGALFSRRGYGVVAPDAFAGLHVVGVEVAAHPVLPPGDPDDGEIADDERCGRDADAVGVGRHRRGPGDLAAAAVERDELCVEGSHQDEVAGDRDPAVRRTAAQPQVVRLLMVVAPEDVAVLGVEGEETVVRGRHIDHAVVHDGGHFELAHRPAREGPGDLEFRDRFGVQARERAVPVPGVVSVVVEPAVGRGKGVVQHRLGDGAGPAPDLALGDPVRAHTGEDVAAAGFAEFTRFDPAAGFGGRARFGRLAGRRRRGLRRATGEARGHAERERSQGKTA